MAAPTLEDKAVGYGCRIHTWELTTADHTGDAVEIAAAADRTVQFTGDPWDGGAGATAALEGSLDGTNFVALTDPQGNAISKTADSIEAVLENVRWVRPRLTTVGTGAAVTAKVLSRNPR